MNGSPTIQEPAAPMRIIETDIGPVVPAVDIVDFIGYSRSSLNKIMKEYEEKMSPCKTYIPLQTTGGIQQFVALNRKGVDYLFLLIKPAKTRMSNDELLEFRKTILDKLGVEQNTVPEQISITRDLLQAKEYALLTDGNIKEFQAAIFRKYNLPELAEALTIPNRLALSAPLIVHGESGWYTPSQLANRCALTVQQFNQWLRNCGFQYKEASIWRIQPLAQEHGREYIFNLPGGGSEPRISWRESVLVAAKLKKEYL